MSELLEFYRSLWAMPFKYWITPLIYLVGCFVMLIRIHMIWAQKSKAMQKAEPEELEAGEGEFWR